MDYATEEKLCRLALEVWRQVASEPVAGEAERTAPPVETLAAGEGADAEAW